MIKRRINQSLFFACSLGLFLFFGTGIQGQDNWTLERCVQYALENNIELKNKKLDLHIQQISSSQSWWNLTPSLSSGTGVSYNIGRNVNQETNDITYDKSLYNNYYMEASVNLFSGLLQYRTIQYYNTLLKASEQESAITENILITNLMNAYYTVLFCKELAQVALSQSAISKKQTQRVRRLVEIGKESAVKLQEFEHQEALADFNAIRAENDYRKSLLSMRQWLNLSPEISLEVVNIPDNNIEVSRTFDTLSPDFSQLPQIAFQKYQLQAAKHTLQQSVSEFFPTVSLSVGMYTNYYSFINSDKPSTGFSKQLNDKLNEQIYLGVSIPIYKRMNRVHKFQQQRIQVEKEQNRLDEKTIQEKHEFLRLSDENRAAVQEYLASESLVASAQKSLENAEKKLENGLLNAIEFQMVQQQYTDARARAIKSKLLLAYSQNVLQHYSTGNWNHLK